MSAPESATRTNRSGRIGNPESALDRDTTAAIERATEHLVSLQGINGIWSDLYLGGSVYPAIASLALNTLGIDGSAYYQEDKGVLLNLIHQQRSDGSFSATPGGSGSKGVTLLALEALKMGTKRNPGIIADQRLASKFNEARDRALKFLEQRSQEPLENGNWAWRIVADLLWDVSFQEEADPVRVYFFGVSKEAFAFAMHHMANIIKGTKENAPMQSIRPALMVLQIEALRSWYPFGKVLGKILDIGMLLSGNGNHAVKRQILCLQDANGSFAESTHVTALYLMALKTLGMTKEDKPIQRAVEFLREARQKLPDDQVSQGFTDADIWDTAEAGSSLLRGNWKATTPQLRTAIQALLVDQHSSGRWAFDAGATHELDNDSTASAAMFLAMARKTAASDQIYAMDRALHGALRALVHHQLKDGGWNAFEKTGYSLKKGRTMSTEEAMLLDPSTADLTGRALSSLLAIKDSGLVMTCLEAKELDRSIARGVAFLRAMQSENGLWWARWSQGYLISSSSVLAPLRAIGIRPDDPTMTYAREAYLRAQNPDGGFGETAAADFSIHATGQGPSRVEHTAAAVVSLVATSPVDDVSKDPHIQSAVQFLISAMQENSWHGSAVGTVFPGEYYSTPLNTHIWALRALRLYKDAVRSGVDSAIGRFHNPNWQTPRGEFRYQTASH